MAYPDSPSLPRCQAPADKPDGLLTELHEAGRAINRIAEIPRIEAVGRIEAAGTLTTQHLDHSAQIYTEVSPTYAVRRPTSGDMGAVAPVLAAMWCRSVGSSWTLELRELTGDTTLGAIMDWITSGIPISQPEPEALARVLLAERGLQLFHDPSAGPCTHTRHGIGYVCRDAELITLAHLVRDAATEVGVHPVGLATLWIAAGFSADAAASRIREGVPITGKIDAKLTEATRSTWPQSRPRSLR